MSVIVVVYLFVRKYEIEKSENLPELMNVSKDTNVVVHQIESLLTINKNDNLRPVLNSICEQLKEFKVSTAYNLLDKIKKSLEEQATIDYKMLMSVETLMGICARFAPNLKCDIHYNKAYEYMQKLDVEDVAVLEGQIYVLCRNNYRENIDALITALKNVEPNSPWIFVPELFFSENLDESYAKIEHNKYALLALANAVMLRGGENTESLGVNVHSFECERLNELTMENFPLWVFYMSIVLTRFVQSMVIRRDVKFMNTPEAQELYVWTDKYLIELSQKSELKNLLVDTVFLHALTGYFADQDPKWLTIMEQEKENVKMKELYFLGDAIMLRSAGKQEEARNLLRNYGDDAISSIYNMRLSIAMEVGDIDEMVMVFREVCERKLDVPDHLLGNFMSVVNLFYEKVADCANALVISTEDNRFLYEQFVLYKAEKDVEIENLRKREKAISSILYPYLALIYRKAMGVSEAVSLLEPIVDRTVADFRTFLLLDLYREDEKYNVKRFHLLRDLRIAGERVESLLAEEMQMAEYIQDYETVYDISTLLLEINSKNGAVLVYHLKSVVTTRRSNDEIMKWKDAMYHATLDDNCVLNIVNIIHTIGETALALELLYYHYKRSGSQILKDHFFMKSLIPAYEKIISSEKDYVEENDLVTLLDGEERYDAIVIPGSVYAVLVGASRKDQRTMMNGKSVVVEDIHNKYYAVLKDDVKDVHNNISQVMRSFTFDANNPMKSLSEMIGRPEDLHAIRMQKEDDYKRGDMPLMALINHHDYVADMYNYLFGKFHVRTHPNEMIAHNISDNFDVNKMGVVLDLSSLLLLYFAEKKIGITYLTKFSVPKGLVCMLQDARLKEEDGMPALILEDVVKILGDTRSDESHSLLWNWLTEILDWVNLHCSVEIVEEKLFLTKISQIDIVSQIEMDSVLLANGRILLTEDWGLIGVANSSSLAMSTSNWLCLSGNKQSAEFCSWMIECHNIGYAISADYFASQFDRYFRAIENTFDTCVENVSLTAFNYAESIRAAYLIYEMKHSESENTSYMIIEMLFASCTRDIVVLILLQIEGEHKYSEAFNRIIMRAARKCYPEIFVG